MRHIRKLAHCLPQSKCLLTLNILLKIIPQEDALCISGEGAYWALRIDLGIICPEEAHYSGLISAGSLKLPELID